MLCSTAQTRHVFTELARDLLIVSTAKRLVQSTKHKDPSMHQHAINWSPTNFD